MSSPVQPNSFVQVPVYQPKEQNVKEEKKVIDVEVLDQESIVQEKETDLKKEFDSLIKKYYTTIQVTAGCGESAEGYIKSEWRKLVKFVEDHPEFKSELPQSKQKSYDDKTNGMSTGLYTAFTKDSRKRDDDCVIS